MLKTNTSAANAAASIILNPEEGFYTNIKSITAGYSAAPTAGTLNITEDGVTIFSGYIGAGATQLKFEDFKVGDKVVVLTLTAGGSGIIGKLNVETTYKQKY